MMSLNSDKQWRRLCASTGIPDFSERYSNARQLQLVFGCDSTARTELGDAHNPNIPLSNAFYSLEMVRYMLVRAIALKSPRALRQLMDPACDKTMALHAVVYLSNLLHGVYVLNRVATAGDFQGVMRRGSFFDNAMLSFHVVNYLYHTGETLQHADHDDGEYWDKMTSLTCHSPIYTAEKVQQTRGFSELLIVELEEIYASGHFDTELLELNSTMGACIAERHNNATDENLQTHLQAWLFHAFRAPPLYIQRLQTLVQA